MLTVHDALSPLGEVAAANAALESALELVNQGENEEVRFSRASVNLRMGRARAQAGYTEQALIRLNAALTDFEAGDHPKDRAVTLGDVALLRAQGGDVAGALKLHKEKLQICRDLGDIDAIANAQYDLASLEVDQGNYGKALERLAESWAINLRIGRADGQLYGRLLATTDPPQALEILRASREAFRLLGITAKINELDELIAKLEAPSLPQGPVPTSLWQKLHAVVTRWFGR